MKKQKEAADASLAKATADTAARQPDPNAIQPIVRPKGEAGDKKRGFELRGLGLGLGLRLGLSSWGLYPSKKSGPMAMKLEGKEHKELFLAIQVFTFVT